MIALVLASLAGAQEEALGLDQVLASVAMHPQFAAEGLRVEVARAELLAARGAFDPVARDDLSWTPVGEYEYLVNVSRVEVPTAAWGATLHAGWALGIGEIPQYHGDYATPPNGQVFAGVDLPLLRDGRVDRARVAVGKARLQVDAAAAGLAIRRIDLERQAVHRYADWAAAGQRLRIAETLVTLAEARDGWFRSREGTGDIASFDRLDNERLVVQRRARAVEERRAFEKAQLALSLLLRGPDGAPVLAAIHRVPDALPDLAPPADPLESALAARPELALLDALRDQVAWDARWARNQMLPALDVLGEVTTDPTGSEPMALNAGVRFELPLLLRSARGRADVAGATALRVTQEAQLQRERVAVEVADARSALRAAHDRIAQLRAELELARALERGEVRRYELGESNLMFVNVREVATADAEAALATALADRLRAAADARAASGQG